MSENTNLTYYQKNRDVVLRKGKDSHKNNKGRLREKARDKYRNFSEEEKVEKREYGKIGITRCLKRKNKAKRISKNYREVKKSQYNNK